MFSPSLNPISQDVLDVGRSVFAGSGMLNVADVVLEGDSFNNGNIRNGIPNTIDGGYAGSGSAGGAGRSGDVTYSQLPMEIPYTAGVSSGNMNNILSYPADLGSGDRRHFTKIEVFVVKTNNTNLLGGGQQAQYDDETVPRVYSNRGDLSDIQRNQVKYTKLQEMIGLPIPDSLPSDYSMSWSRAEGGLISDVVSLVDVATSPEAREQYSWMNSIAIGLGSKLTNLASQAGMGGAETNLKLLTKRASNPRNEFLFDGVNNRSFSMTWKFIPKTAKESETLHLILEKMKLYMHPELDESTAGKFFIFPAIFDITFMSGSEENKHLYRASSCALTNMLVNPMAGGQSAFYDGTDAPFGYDVTMQFVELEFLHRARFLTDSNSKGVAR